MLLLFLSGTGIKGCIKGIKQTITCNGCTAYAVNVISITAALKELLQNRLNGRLSDSFRFLFRQKLCSANLAVLNCNGNFYRSVPPLTASSPSSIPKGSFSAARKKRKAKKNKGTFYYFFHQRNSIKKN